MSHSVGPRGSAWVVSIGAELERVAQARRKDDQRYIPYMFRVPLYIKTLKPEAYKHQVLSFGVYDRDFVNMTRMDEVRLEVVSEFLEQVKTMFDSCIASWDALCECVAGPLESAQQLRHSYDDGPRESDITSTTLRSVLTFDAVFLMVFLLFYSKDFPGMRLPIEKFERFESIFQQKGVNRDLSAVYFDLWLFENQIPLRLIRHVWNQAYEDNTNERFNSHIRLTINIAMDTYMCPRAEFLSGLDICFGQCYHLLHCLYIAVCHHNPADQACQAVAQTSLNAINVLHQPPSPSPPADSTLTQRTMKMLLLSPRWVWRILPFRRTTWPSANDARSQRSLLPITELHKAGIIVKGVQTSVTDIKFVKSTFYKATLYLPQIDVDDNTEKILRNLASFEMIYSDGEHKLISYLSIMDDLINTEDDVRLLRKGKDPVIGVNNLGDDHDIAALFNALGQNVCFTKSKECITLTKEVNQWCTQEKRQKFIRFIDRFLDRPWIGVSLIAATLLMFMTGLQTIYTMLGYY